MIPVDIEKLSREVMPYAVEMRRYLHRHPEITCKEFQTVKFLQEQLREMDIPFVNIPDGGILATIGADPADPTLPHVMLRADCDALPIEEAEENARKKKICLSENPGAGHLCGHDAHMAMLLSAAKVMKALPEGSIKGTVYLLFERGEEGGNRFYYILQYIQQHSIRIDSCFALHVDPDIPVGKLCVNPGPGAAGSVNFEIVLTGKGGHGSRPDLANSPIDCFVAIANQLKDFKNKYLDPTELLTYNIGTVQSGGKRNIVPETLKFNGTARYYNVEAGMAFKKWLGALLEANAALYNCSVEYERFDGPSFPQTNDPGAAAFAARVIGELLGKERIVDRGINLAAESFANITVYYPGALAWLGVRNEAEGMTATLHNPRFDLDEEAMAYGIACHICYALNYLEQRPQLDFTPFDGDIDALMEFIHRPIPPRYDDKQ